jgi:hypothetical protein
MDFSHESVGGTLIGEAADSFCIQPEDLAGFEGWAKNGGAEYQSYLGLRCSEAGQEDTIGV